MAMSTSSGSGRPRMMAEINITPFTDVCLVLLIIFMVSASFLGSPRAAEVKLPAASRGVTNPLPPRDITVTVGKGGELYADSKKVTVPELYRDLKDYSKTFKIRNIIIKGDREVVYDQIVKVMAAAREAGVSYMSLVVQQDGAVPNKGG